MTSNARTPLRLRLARLILTIAVVAGVSFTSTTTATAAPGYSTMSSPDGTARVQWSYDVVTGAMSWILSDTMRDGECVRASAWTFSQRLGWSSEPYWIQACDRLAIGSFTERARFQSYYVSVCGADSRCTKTTTDPGCSIDYPVRLDVVVSGPNAQKHRGQMVACTDLRSSMTSLTNNSDVVWTVTDRRGWNPQAWNRDSTSQSLFRSVRPDGRTVPMLLNGATTVVALAPSELVWQVDDLLSAAWLTHDAMVDEVTSYATTAAVDRITKYSPKWGALATCALAGWNAASYYDDVDGSDLADAVMDGVPVVGGSVSCAASVAKTFTEVRWPTSDGVKAIDELVNGASWMKRFSVMDEIAEFLGRARIVP